MIKPNSAIQYYDNILSPELCGEIIEGFDRDIAGLVHSSKVNDGVDYYARDSQQIHLTEARVGQMFGERAHRLIQEVYISLAAVALRYDDDISGVLSRLVPWEYDQMDILKYDQDLGNYKTHIDTDGRQGMDRLFSVIIYLNTVEFGGETCFPLQDKIIQPVEGRVAIFPSNFAFPHKACTPTSGDKYVLVAWTKASHNLR